MDSSKNFPRQLENASQYATGIPITSRMAETQSARRNERKRASMFVNGKRQPDRTR